MIFFQELVRNFFADVELAESLPATFKYLQTFFPLEAMTFDQYIEASGELKIEFLVNQQGFFPLNRSFVMDQAAQVFLQVSEQSRSIRVHSDNSRYDVAKQHSELVKDYVITKPRAYMNSVLASGNEVLGHLVFIGTTLNCFTAHHERLMGMLLSPFSIGFHHRFEVKRLKETQERLDAENARLEREFALRVNTALIGSKSGLKNVVESIRHLENKDTPVLITGETGTGKELVADAVQRISRRRNAPFIKINCGAIPENLMESELFGHEKGAFTGAILGRSGYFERAHGGTLFLDEVGELSLQAQVQLLRILQTGAFERLGGSKTIKTDVRIIAATNQNLYEMRKKGNFREDLYHRLAVFPVNVPPLRERIEDIPLLIRYFVNNTAARMGIVPPALEGDSMDKLMQYSWPGNVRELENLVERSLIFNPEAPLNIAKYLPQEHGASRENHVEQQKLERLIDKRIAYALHMGKMQHFSEYMDIPATTAAKGKTLDDMTRTHIIEALAACKGKIYGPGGAAERLSVKHGTLRYRIKKLGIDTSMWRV